jgi:hypothetical protein
VPDARFELPSTWRVAGDREEVWDLLTDACGMTRWWPEVYLGVEALEEGDAEGVGTLITVHSRGWLPYHLRWRARVVEARHPETLALEATGDLVGRGRWTLTQAGAEVVARYDWVVVAERPLLRRLSAVIKPVLAANHRWAMARGEAGLRHEPAARRAARAAHGTGSGAGRR